MKTPSYFPMAVRRGVTLFVLLTALLPATLTGQFQNRLLSSQADKGVSVVDIDNNQYVLLQQVEVGRLNADLVLSKLDAAGKILPGGIRLGSEKREFPRYLQKAFSKDNKHDGYIIVGETDFGSPEGMTDLFLIRTNLTGEALWAKRYGNPKFTETGVCVIQLPDKGFAAVGISKEGTGKTGMYVVRTDFDGNPTWNRVFYDESGFSQANFVEFVTGITSKGGLYVVGTARTNSKDPDVILLNLDPQEGSVVWANRYWHSDQGVPETGMCLRQVKTEKGPGLVITGTSGNDEFTFVVLSASGAPIWGNRYAAEGTIFKPVGIVPADREGKNLLVGGTLQRSRDKMAFYHKILLPTGDHVLCNLYAWDTTNIMLNDVRQTFGGKFTGIGYYQSANDTYVLNATNALVTPPKCPPKVVKITVRPGIKQEAVKMTTQNRDFTKWQVLMAKFEQKERRCI